MHFTCRSFVGASSDVAWSQFWENEPDDLNKILTYGHLFGLISISAEDSQKSISQIGKDIINEINAGYFSSSHADPLLRLQDCLKSVGQNPLFNLSSLDIVVAIVIDSQIFLSALGQVNACLLRQGQIAILLPDSSSAIRLISGPANPDDRLLLYTQQFVQGIGWSVVKSAVAYPKINQVEEELISRLYTLSQSANSSAAFVQIHQDNLVEASEAPVPPTSPPLPPPTPSPTISSPSSFSPSLFSKAVFSRLFRQRSVFVSTHTPHQINRRKKFNLFFALVLLILLGAASFFGYQKNQQHQAETRFQQLKTALDKNLADASAVKNLNLDSANQLAKQSQEIITKMRLLQIHLSEISEYEQTVNLLLAQTGASDGFTPDSFFDASIIVNKPKYSDLVFDNDYLYLIDYASDRIDRLLVSQKNSTNLLNQVDISNFSGSLIYNGDLYLYNDTAVVLVKNKKIETKIDLSKEPGQPKVVSLQPWTGNLYLLDQKNLSILKFSPSGSGFSSGQSWLKDKQSIPPQPVSMAINGKVWILLNDGQIIPYVRGQKDNFKPQQSPSTTSAANLIVGVDKEIIIFTDKNQYLYVYKKNGEVVSKYNFGQLAISHPAYDEKNDLVYVLCQDQKIYQIKLK